MHDRALFLIMALVLNAAAFGPRSWYMAMGITGAMRFPGQLVRGLERRLNREHRAPEERMWRGAVLLGFVVFIAGLFGWMLGALIKHEVPLLELVVLAASLHVREVFDIGLGIRKHLIAGNLNGARHVLTGTPWKHHALMDEPALCRAAIELAGIQFSEKIFAPLLWYMLLGLPGLFISKAAYLMQEALSSSQGGTEDFGRASASFHQFMHTIPAHMAAILWLATSPFLPGKSGKAWAIVQSEMGGSPDRISLASVAGVLNLALGGPTSIYLKGAWVGDGTPRAEVRDILRALYLFALLHLLLLILLGAFL